MEWLQKVYILILNPFCSLSEKIDNRIRKALMFFICFLLYSTCYIWYSIIGTGTPLTLLSRMLQSILLIMILILLGLEKPMQVVKWNKAVIYTWFALGMLIFIMGFFTEQNTGYWMTGPVIALGLPCLYMVYGRDRKYMCLLDAISKAAIICTIIYFFVCLAGECFNDNTWCAGRYNGLTKDANKIAELCLASFCCILYRFLTIKEHSRWNILAVVSMGILIGQIYWTQSRTTILAVILVLAFYFIIVLKGVFAEKKVRCLLEKLVPLLLSAVIGLASVAIIDEVRNIRQGTSDLIITAEAAVEEDDQYREMLPDEGADLDMYSSGRIKIWSLYIEKFNFIGNDADAETPISPEIWQKTAHNSFIEITYRSGYVTGFVYLFLELITGIFILKVMIRKNEKNSGGDYFMAITSIAYIVFTNLMSSYNPLTAIIFLLYAIAFPVLLEPKKPADN